MVDVEERENIRLVAHIGGDANAPESAVAISHLYMRDIFTSTKKASGNVYLCLIEIVQVVDTDQLGRVRAARSCHLKHNFGQINKIHFLLSFAPQT